MKKLLIGFIGYFVLCMGVLILSPTDVIRMIVTYIAAILVLCLPVAAYFKYTQIGRFGISRIRGIMFCLLRKQSAKGLSIAEGVRIQNPTSVSFGNQVSIDHDAEFYPLGGGYPSKISIGNHVHIGAYNRFASKYEVKIEDNVLFAAYVHITDHSHEFRDIGIPVINQGTYEKGSVLIGEGSWIGFRANILSGVTIGKHCVVAAGAVVTKSVPDYCVVAGCPARVIKKYDFQKKEWVSP